MKKLTTILFGLFAAASLQAQVIKSTVATVTAVTPLTILTGGKYTITDIQFLNTAATNGTVKFYDSASNKTNYVQASYVSLSPISTNWVYNFTNSAGIVITNTFKGTYMQYTTNAAATNELPSVLGPVIVAQSSLPTDIVDVAYSPANGLTIYSTVGGQVEVTYKQLYP